MPPEPTTWFPLFEFQDFTYQSFLVLPTKEQSDATPGASVTARKWARGALNFGQAFTESPDGYTVAGGLSFGPDYDLWVSAKGALGSGDTLATFEGTGTGTGSKTKGAVYRLVGWVFPDQPLVGNAGRVQRICGSVCAVRGPDANPNKELGGVELGTVGWFLITRKE